MSGSVNRRRGAALLDHLSCSCSSSRRPGPGRDAGGDRRNRRSVDSASPSRAAGRAPAVARASGARARGLSGTAGLPVLRRRPAQAGEDVTEMLELVPRQWKSSARAGEVLLPQLREINSAAGAVASDPLRGRAGPGLLAHVLFASTAASAADRQSTTLPVRASNSTSRPWRLGGAAAATADAAGRGDT